MSFNHIVLQNIVRDKWTYISYFLSCVFSVLVFFLFSITAFHPMMDSISNSSTLGLAMIFASFIVYIFSFGFIIYSLFAFQKKKMKNLGIFMITGASMKQVRRMVFRENMLIAGTSVVSALALGLVIAPLFLMIAKQVLQTEDFGMYVPVLPIVLTLVLFAFLFTTASKFMTRFIKKEEAIQLLKTEITPERSITPAPWRLLSSLAVTASLLIALKLKAGWIESSGLVYYVLLFTSLLASIYFTITQLALVMITTLQRRPSYYKKTNMLFVSNLKAKGRSHANQIYLLTLLLLGVFTCTSVLYSSFYTVKETTEKLYPYSFQYTSLPENTPADEQRDLKKLEAAIAKTGKYETYHAEFKTDLDRRIAFMPVSAYNALGLRDPITLESGEYYAAAGNDGVDPPIEAIHDYPFGTLKLAGMETQNPLTTGFQNVYYIVPEEIYEQIDYPVYKVSAYELENWTEKTDAAEQIMEEFPIQPGYLIASKIQLYSSEKFTKSILFFIGFMLSLIFLSAAMSIVYFYLQTSLEGEREKYRGIRKIGLSVKELSSIVTRELATLLFVPFAFAATLLLAAIIGLRHNISQAFYGFTAIGVGAFLLLFIISFFIVRRAYLHKLSQ